jgi:hypothetical protein
MSVRTSREDLAHDLWSYGEDGLAQQVESLPRDEMEAIFERAWYYAMAPEHAAPSGGGMLLSKALALAAVEVIEGRPRELERMRRRPGFAKDRPHISHREAVEKPGRRLKLAVGRRCRAAGRRGGGESNDAACG